MPGNRTKLSSEVIKALEYLLSRGHTARDACAAAQISQGSYYNWLKFGERIRAGETPDNMPSSPEFPALAVQLFEMVTRAQAEARQRAVEALMDGFKSGETTETRTTNYSETRLDKDGRPYVYSKNETTQIVRETPPDWRAALAYLKCRDATHWSERHMVDGKLQLEIVDRTHVPELPDDWRTQAEQDAAAFDPDQADNEVGQ